MELIKDAKKKLVVAVTQEHIDRANLIRKYAREEYYNTANCPVALAVRLTGRPNFRAYPYVMDTETLARAVKWDSTMQMVPFTAIVQVLK